MLEYIDRDGKPMTLEEWGLQMNDEEYRRVDWTTIRGEFYSYDISTVWLGILPNQLFETMIFSRGTSDPSGLDNYQKRAHTLEQAQSMHHVAVATLKQKLGLK